MNMWKRCDFLCNGEMARLWRLKIGKAVQMGKEALKKGRKWTFGAGNFQVRAAATDY